MSNPLHRYKVLIVDSDQHLAKVLKEMLEKMGFSNMQVLRSGRDALQAMQDAPVDFIITEWNTQHIDGIELIDRIRRDPNSPNPTLPIVMLTGRAEQSDVVTARDHGINEYIIKPFSVKTIYNRLERIIEYPKHFVVAQDFIGPDRRNKGVPPDGVADRRTMRLTPQHQPQDPAGQIKTSGAPKLWVPSYALKQKLGANVSLPALITPAVLNLAQATIEAITSDSLQWVKENLAEIKTLCHDLADGEHEGRVAHDIGEAALVIKTRAGTFGYAQAAEVAYLLYLFCRNYFQPGKPIHRIIIGKHVDVLQVILGQNMRGIAATESTEIIAELRNLAQKYGV